MSIATQRTTKQGRQRLPEQARIHQIRELMLSYRQSYPKLTSYQIGRMLNISPAHAARVLWRMVDLELVRADLAPHRPNVHKWLFEVNHADG